MDLGKDSVLEIVYIDTQQNRIMPLTKHLVCLCSKNKSIFFTTFINCS